MYKCRNCKWEFEEPAYEKEVWYTDFGEERYQDDYFCPLCGSPHFEEFEEEKEDA